MRALVLALALSGCSLIVDPPPAGEHPEILVNEIVTGDQANPAAVFVAGRYFVVWQDDSGASLDSDETISGRFLTPAGEPEGTDLAIVGTMSTETAGLQNHPQVAVRGDSMFVVWIDEGTGNLNLEGRIVSNAGTLDGDTKEINSTKGGAQEEHQLVALETGFFVVWTDGSPGQPDDLHDIRGRLFDPDGNGILEDFVINPTAAGDQIQPHVARSSMNMLVVWTDNQGTEGGDIRGQLRTLTGGPESADFVINTTTNGTQSEPFALALSGDRYLVAWTDGSAGDGDLEVRGQFVGAGGPEGDELVLNERTEGNQGHPKLIQLSDGTIVLSYEDGSMLAPDTEPNGIRRRRFTPDGTPIGTEDQVNTFYKNEQEDSALVADPAGNVLLLWEDGGGSPPDNDGDSIRARIYQPGR